MGKRASASSKVKDEGLEDDEDEQPSAKKPAKRDVKVPTLAVAHTQCSFGHDQAS